LKLNLQFIILFFDLIIIFIFPFTDLVKIVFFHFVQDKISDFVPTFEFGLFNLLGCKNFLFLIKPVSDVNRFILIHVYLLFWGSILKFHETLFFRFSGQN